MNAVVLAAVVAARLVGPSVPAGLSGVDPTVDHDCRAPSLRVLASTDAPSTARPSWAGPGVPEAVWRLAAAAAVTDDGDERKCLLRVAEDSARASVTAAPDDVARRFALAAVLGLRADREGGRTKVHAASALYAELDTILVLDPEHAGAHHLMGRLHAGVRRMDRVTRWIATHLLGGGLLKQATWAEAERHLAFAESRSPEVLDYHYELARLYEDTGRPAEAVEEARHVLALPAASPMDEAVREKAARLVDELCGNAAGAIPPPANTP